MPPRYAYWTILVDDQPTAFRASAQEDLLPTFKRLKQKHPTAVMKWFQNGKLWDSRVDAQEAMHARGERGRSADPRQSGFRNRDRSPGPGGPKTARPFGKPDWKPRGAFQKPEAEGRGPGRNTQREGRLEWKPKGSFDRDRKPEWKPKSTFQKSDAEGGGSRRSAQRESGREGRLEWKPKGSFDRDYKPEWKTRGGAGGGRPQAASPKPPGREGAWIPKAEYKQSRGIEAKRDKNWRPGGQHKDPRQKYKDAKKAKWSRFKATVRARWETKQGKKKS